MSVAKKKLTTSEQVKPTPPLPSQAEFQQYLRQQAQIGLRVVLEQVMQEELTALLKAQWGEHTPERQGHRNGFYSRDLGTTTGTLTDLQVPRDREGQFQTQVFEQYRRYQPQIEEGLTQMFVAGVSCERVGGSRNPVRGSAFQKCR